jgi:hypothetical protein
MCNTTVRETVPDSTGEVASGVASPRDDMLRRLVHRIAERATVSQAPALPPVNEPGLTGTEFKRKEI